MASHRLVDAESPGLESAAVVSGERKANKGSLSEKRQTTAQGPYERVRARGQAFGSIELMITIRASKKAVLCEMEREVLLLLADLLRMTNFPNFESDV